ncbi:hypothetical protein [Pseudonocardia dioxanivorans]|uniref:hypothetical protein n=1 Tax=Pseudonocardia dioxanivorans TaxID=240495 RepID=UPI001052D439|nr:hypothetical protein [Pseudonocardia dioxanivorans]
MTLVSSPAESGTALISNEPAIPALVPILLAMRELMSSSEPWTIAPADLRAYKWLGATIFPRRTIYIDPLQDWEDWAETLLHELIHALRGPLPEEEYDAEEAIVEAATRRIMRSMLAELRAAIGAQR